MARKHQALRIERLCTVIVSRDHEIEYRLKSLLKNDQELQVVIPFTYDELLKKDDPNFIISRFRNWFYYRDLFDFQSPLRKDLFFFGMRDLVQSLVNRLQSNENSALFGLRKSGKTSVIYGVERTLDRINIKSVRIDCENTTVHKRRWHRALWYLIYELRVKYSLEPVYNEDAYTEQNAGIVFERDLNQILGILEADKVVFIFDEIEQITFGTSVSEHWREGLDFIYFWQTLRAIFQKSTNLFTYMLVGTNPMCVERAVINKHDNPIFNQTPSLYIPRFDVPQVQEMVSTLGQIMGLNFDNLIYSKLCEDFGGHPFLIRQVCSLIHKIAPNIRPFNVDRSVYEQAKNEFEQNHSSYIEMILTVLKNFYSDEYEMISLLAKGDVSTFNEFANDSSEYTNHLLGYGIIELTHFGYRFRIESVKKYLENVTKYQKITMSPEERLAEISERRNKLEPKLRQIVRTVLLSSMGKSEATTAILDILGSPRSEKYKGMAYERLMSGDSADVYFSDLEKIFLKHWEKFENIFGKNRDSFRQRMTVINQNRKDAHANPVNNEELAVFRHSISAIELSVNEFLG